MEKLFQVWNVVGPNQYGLPFTRILYEDRRLSKNLLTRIASQIGMTEPSEGIHPLVEISKRLQAHGCRESYQNILFESTNNQAFLLYFNMNVATSLSLFRDSSYLLDRLLNNPLAKLEYLIKELRSPIHSSPHPVVFGVTGTNGKTTVVNLIYNLLMKCVAPSINVGKVDSLNTEINLQPINGIVDEQYDASRYLLTTDIHAAVLELTRKGIWFSGLPSSRLSTGVITNIANDHIGTYGVTSLEDLLKIKSVVAKNSDIVVLNHRDPRLKKLGTTLEGRVIYFSSIPNGEIKSFDDSVYLGNDGAVFITANGKRRSLVKVNDIPFCEHGKLPHNIENVLASISAIAFDNHFSFDLNKISDYLKSLHTNDLVPARFNKYLFDGRALIFDYAHNPDAVKNIGKGLERLGYEKVSCLVSVDENRDIPFCAEMAQQLVKYFDVIYLKEPDEICKFEGGITTRNLEEAILDISPKAQIIHLKKNSYIGYLEFLKEGDVGVILGTGMGNLFDVRADILAYLSERGTKS